MTARAWLAVLLALAVVSAHAQPVDFDDTDEEPDLVDEGEVERDGAAVRSERLSDTHSSTPLGAAQDDYYDADEFVGAPIQEVSPPVKSAVPERKPQVEPAQPVVPKTWRDFIPEIGCVAVLVIYALNYLRGRTHNDRVAKAWISEMQPIFETQFFSLGAYQEGETGVLLKESQSCYKYFCSGRRNCDGLLATLDLKKRHDLFSVLASLLDLGASQDLVTIEVPMDDAAMEPFVFAVVQRKSAARIKKQHKDLEYFAAPVTTKRLPEQYVVLSDCAELEADLLDERVVRTLEDNADVFVSLHFTDQHSGSFNMSKKMLRFTFQLPTDPEAVKRLVKLTQMAVYFIDKVATTALSTTARARAVKVRKELADKEFRATHEQRQEAAQKRKEELRRKEEEEYANLSEEQKRKRDEREYKQQLKKKQPRMKMMR